MPRLPALCSLVLLSAVGLAHAQPPAAAPDVPTAKWVKMADVAGDDRLKGFQAPEGVKVEVVAEAPVLTDPVGLAFGPDGTLFVAERHTPKKGELTREDIVVTYKDGSRRAFVLTTSAVKGGVKALRDRDGDGRYEAADVLLEADFPAGLLFHDGHLYLATRGEVRRHKWDGAAGQLGEAEVIARGFGGDGLTPVAGLTVGNDGWLYATASPGDHSVEGADGSRADVSHTGAVFRCRPDGSKVELFARGLGRSDGNVAFDAVGNLFAVDAGGAGGRLLHVAEEGDYGVRSGEPQAGGPAVLAPLTRGVKGAPAGLFVYGDTGLPLPFQGVLYGPGVGDRVIRGHTLEPAGASFRLVERFELVKTGENPFRPRQVVSGPDGALYVCTSRGTADGGQGRVYRLSWAGTGDNPAIEARKPDAWAGIRKQSDEELLKTLAGANATDRYQAQTELRRRGDKNNTKLVKLLRNEGEPLAARVAALGVLYSFWDESATKAARGLVTHPRSDLRRLAAEALGRNVPRGDLKTIDKLTAALNEENPAVLRAVALALGRVGNAGVADSLVNVLRFERTKDPVLREGVLRALERLGTPGVQALLVLAGSGVRADIDLAADAFVELRGPAAAEGLPELLLNMHLSDAQRAALIRSTRHYPRHTQSPDDPPGKFVPALEKFLSGDTPPVADSRAARAEALRALARLRPAAGVKAAEAVLASGDAALQKEAVAVLGRETDGARRVARDFLAGKLPQALRPRVVDALRRHAEQHADVRELLERVRKGKTGSP